MPDRVTQTVTPEGSGLLAVLLESSCYSFSWALITAHGGSREAPRLLLFSRHTLAYLHGVAGTQILLGIQDQHPISAVTHFLALIQSPKKPQVAGCQPSSSVDSLCLLGRHSSFGAKVTREVKPIVTERGSKHLVALVDSLNILWITRDDSGATVVFTL